MLSAWPGGLRAGLLATGLSLVAFDYYLIAPDYTLAAQTAGMPRLLIFALAALFVSLLGATQRTWDQSRRPLPSFLLEAWYALAGPVAGVSANAWLTARWASRARSLATRSPMSRTKALTCQRSPIRIGEAETSTCNRRPEA